MFTPGRILTLFALSGACCFGMLWAQQDERPKRNRTEAELRTGQPAAAASPAAVVSPISVAGPAAPAGALPLLDSVSVSNPPFGTAVAVAPNGQRYEIARPTFQSSATGQLLNKALKAYRDAKPDSAERREARKNVAEGLSKLYDESLENQAKQIEELSQRLENLREQLGKRRDAKARMVELKLEMVLSQAEGLGFPESSDAQFRGGPVSSYRTTLDTSNPFGGGAWTIKPAAASSSADSILLDVAESVEVEATAPARP